MGNIELPDAANVAAWVAKQLLKNAKHATVTEHEVAEAVSEVEHQTQTRGASFIKIHFGDPQWKLVTSGLFDRNPEGLLPELQVEFPQASGWHWTLCACEPSNELSQANFVCTFEDRIVRTLIEKWGPKRAKPGFNTRAEFVKGLCIEAKVKYCIPSVEGAQERKAKERTAFNEQFNKTFNERFNRKFNEEFNRRFEKGEIPATPESESAAVAKAAKPAGVGAGAPVTVKGTAASPRQIATVNEVMSIAVGLKAPQLAIEALMAACIVESEFGKDEGGLLQLEPTTAREANVTVGDVAQEVAYVLQKGATGIGGMISLARAHPSYPAWKIAQEEQGSGAGKSTEGASNYGPWVDEAKKLIQAYGGAQATGGGTPATSKEGEVTRGTTSNPSENSWDCMIRLASQVNWSVFTNGQTLFFMDGPEMAQQRPAAYVYPAPLENKMVRENGQGHKTVETGVIQVPLNATFDNTSVEFFEDHKVKGKVQKRSRVGRPQAPSEIKMNVVCGLADYAAGEAFEVLKAGPLNGRWIIVDATRNTLKDRFTTFLLEPPTAPVAETEEGKPAEHAETTTPEGTSGNLAAVAEQALKAWGEHDKYQYTQAIPDRENNGTLYGPAPRKMDCSSFAELCYKAAGLPDPSGQNYHPVGNTNSLIGGMERVSGRPEPGDLAFFGSSVSSTEHVVVYVGNSEAVGMETYGVNMLKGSVESLGTGAGSFLGYWRPK